MRCAVSFRQFSKTLARRRTKQPRIEDLNLELDASDVILNATLIGTTGNLEETTITPLLVPRVLDQPVWCSVLGTPSDHFHGVSAKKRSGLVCVDTRLVCWEVRVDREGDSKRPVVHDGGLHGFDATEAHGTSALGLVVSIRLGVSGGGA